MTQTSPIILASQSPRRKQLLEWAEINFEVMVANTDESYPPSLPNSSEIAMYIARQKALAVREKIRRTHPADAIVIAADTIVVLEEMVIGKPIDRTDAIQTLQRLAGRRHDVVTGVVIAREQRETIFADITSVQFHPLTEAQIEFYVDRYAPYDKAGAYAIQEWIGVVGIQSVHGDFYNVMGLPVSRVVQALELYR